MITTRRTFIAASGLAAASPRTLLGAPAQGPKSPLGKPIGLELYSLRRLLEKDVPSTLAKVRKMGFIDVEVPGLYKQSAEAMGGHIKKAGLQARSYIVPYDRLSDKLDEVIKESHALGSKWVVCAWIPHKGTFATEHLKPAIATFSKCGQRLKSAGLRFAYHIHGYEFEPSATDGTLMDTLIKSTPADLVAIEMDVFWVRRGGCDPMRLIEAYPGRFPLFHLKDIAKGIEICKPNGNAPDDTSVPLGAGMIDWPGLLKAATAKAGVEHYFIEDEHPDAEKQIPVSLKYLAGLKI